MKKPIVLIVSLSTLILLGVYLVPKDPACVRLNAKLLLMDDFCNGMSKQLAEDRCGQLTDDEAVFSQCLRVVIPAAHSGCMNYINKHKLESEYKSLCQ